MWRQWALLALCMAVAAAGSAAITWKLTNRPQEGPTAYSVWHSYLNLASPQSLTLDPGASRAERQRFAVALYAANQQALGMAYGVTYAAAGNDGAEHAANDLIGLNQDFSLALLFPAYGTGDLSRRDLLFVQRLMAQVHDSLPEHVASEGQLAALTPRIQRLDTVLRAQLARRHL
jgi:hypothetical protein